MQPSRAKQGRWSRPARSAPILPRCRPGLETLENRLAPAVVQVASIQITQPVALDSAKGAAVHDGLRSAPVAGSAEPHVQGKPAIQVTHTSTITMDAKHLDRLFAALVD